MRDIQVSTDVFAKIWSLRNEGEDSEDSILRRVLLAGPIPVIAPATNTQAPTSGLRDQRFGVTFPEGMQIERVYLGRKYCAHVENGQWVVEGLGRRFSRLNELSRAIGTKTENAWQNWHFVDENGQRKPVSDLRDPNRISSRSRSPMNRGTKNMDTAIAIKNVRWCDDIRAALRELGGKAALANIYRKVEEIRELAGRSTPPSLEEVVRKELEMRSSDSEVYDADRGEDWFEMAEGRGAGIWALRVP